MASEPSSQVVVEQIDAAEVRADLLVIPSTTQATFGRPWDSIVGSMRISGPPDKIPLGSVTLLKVTEGERVGYLGFAATLEGVGPTEPAVIERIGRRLGELTQEHTSIRDIATPSLGTGVGRLDPTLSLQALHRGFVATAEPSARLRIIGLDPSILTVLTNALTSMPLMVLPKWEQLTPGAQHTLALCEAYRRASKSTKVHMEHFVAALFDSDDPQVRARFGGVTASEIGALAAGQGNAIPHDAIAESLSAIPALSSHVTAALVAAQGHAGAGGTVSERHLLTATLDTKCSFISALLPRLQAVLADPIADTIPGGGLGRADRLSLGRDVQMLASLALARKTEPPLAIGLFGDWGSGKSFFMAMLDERISSMSRFASTDASSDRQYCSQVRQVHFNAWHYADGNLWASLAATIFDQLVEGPKDVEVSKTEQLGKAAQEEVAARAALGDAEQTLRSARKWATKPTVIIQSGIASVFEAVRNEPHVLDQLKNFDSPDQEGTTSEQLVSVVEAASTIGQRADVFRRLVKVELSKRHRRFTLIWFAIALLTITGLLAALQFDALGKTLVAIGGLLSLAAPTLYAATRTLVLARTARARREKPVEDAEKRLADARRHEQAAAAQRAAAVDELERLRNRGQRLHDLVRSARSEYSSKLSMMSQLRKDFEELSWLLGADPKSVEAPTRSPRDPPPQALVDACLEVSSLGTGDQRRDSLEVERIVLYIDDLDRCPAEDVVKVLQAVHLLLTFKLFVVVLGVDGNWLEASLKARYRELLVEPRDYLEKIIQLPIVLPEMSPDGYTALIDSLTPVAPATGTREKAATERPIPDGSKMDSRSPLTDVPSQGPTDSRVADVGRRGSSSESHRAPDLPPTEPDMKLPNPELLVISSEERALLRRIGCMISTPRTTKRLVNTYRMLRVRAGQDDADHFSPSGDKEYQAVIVLLAVLIGCPGDADEVFARIMAAGPTDDVWQVLRAEVRDKKRKIRDPRITTELEPLVEISQVEAYQRWIPLVSRFTYRLGAVVAPTPTSA